MLLGVYHNYTDIIYYTYYRFHLLYNYIYFSTINHFSGHSHHHCRRHHSVAQVKLPSFFKLLLSSFFFIYNYYPGYRHGLYASSESSVVRHYFSIIVPASFCLSEFIIVSRLIYYELR